LNKNFFPTSGPAAVFKRMILKELFLFCFS